jgi:hypothetical protein
MQRVKPEWVQKEAGLPSKASLYREVRLGRIPHVRLGRRVLFFDIPILEWRDAKLRESQHEPAGIAAGA